MTGQAGHSLLLVCPPPPPGAIIAAGAAGAATPGHFAAGAAGAAGAVLISNARHYNALCSASEALSLVRAGLDSGTPSDLVAQDLRDALYHLGTITGEITTDEVLGNIFRKFCIGK